uniref:Uncharacterized protein n=1 Tax=Arundo donax TaxID=35708 RepID=A0A0A8ZAA9_ARUDO
MGDGTIGWWQLQLPNSGLVTSKIIKKLQQLIIL